MAVDNRAVDKASSIPTGRPVEVWNRSLGRFAGQFEVAGVSPEGVKVRRMSDDAPLPESFTQDEIRPIPGDR
jgi:hypothetical protein